MQVISIIRTNKNSSSALASSSLTLPSLLASMPDWLNLWLQMINKRSNNTLYVHLGFLYFLVRSRFGLEEKKDNNVTMHMTTKHHGFLADLITLLISTNIPKKVSSSSAKNNDNDGDYELLKAIRVLSLCLSNQLKYATIDIIHTKNVSIITSFGSENAITSKSLHAMLEAALIASNNSSNNATEHQNIATLCDVCLRSMSTNKSNGDKIGIEEEQQGIPNSANILVIGQSLKRLHRSKMAEMCMNQIVSSCVDL
jgi:hypothetical protein